MAENKAPVISAVGLSKVFRDFWNRPKAKAVSDIDFEIREGEVVGLLGPNGSGKSTTVKMLLGLLYPTAGQLAVFGRSPRTVAIKKRIGYLPEESYLYKYLTAMETLDFFGSLFNLSKTERRNRSEQLLDMVGLSHVRSRRVGEFSKGMARRIGLAQAMINDPSLLILDEPTSGLDPLGCKEVKDLIMLLKKRGKTVLITSHLLSDVEDICDRVIILYGGKIRAEGPLNDLLTVTEASRITTPAMQPEITEKVLKILRENLSGEEFNIDHPRRTLEEFFLDVIDKAKAESVTTSGVVNSGRIAEYLQEDDKAAKVLAGLSASGDPSPEVAAAKKAVDEKQEQQKIKQENLRIQELTSSLTVEKGPEKQAAAEEFSNLKSEKLSEANEKLKDLLN
ncbi:ABC transporter ATP-binding protein [Lentisphaerota bacterium ZTH]|nr:ABC transporter ATP-binding protein [Lentisphaerota bacterium]WET06590.1 ABC transporter ATP-binding protein [Lentisphaerota bacterium ZTH]